MSDLLNILGGVGGQGQTAAEGLFPGLQSPGGEFSGLGVPFDVLVGNALEKLDLVRPLNEIAPGLSGVPASDAALTQEEDGVSAAIKSDDDAGEESSVDTARVAIASELVLDPGVAGALPLSAGAANFPPAVIPTQASLDTPPVSTAGPSLPAGGMAPTLQLVGAGTESVVISQSISSSAETAAVVRPSAQTENAGSVAGAELNITPGGEFAESTTPQRIVAAPRGTTEQPVTLSPELAGQPVTLSLETVARQVAVSSELAGQPVTAPPETVARQVAVLSELARQPVTLSPETVAQQSIASPEMSARQASMPPQARVESAADAKPAPVDTRLSDSSVEARPSLLRGELVALRDYRSHPQQHLSVLPQSEAGPDLPTAVMERGAHPTDTVSMAGRGVSVPAQNRDVISLPIERVLETEMAQRAPRDIAKLEILVKGNAEQRPTGAVSAAPSNSSEASLTVPADAKPDSFPLRQEVANSDASRLPDTPEPGAAGDRTGDIDIQGGRDMSAARAAYPGLAPTESAHRPAVVHVGRPEAVGEAVQQQVVTTLRGMAGADGKFHAELQLHPPELGSVKIKIVVNNRRVDLHITVESREVGRLVESNTAELRHSMGDRGFHMSELNVFVSDGGRDGADAQQFEIPKNVEATADHMDEVDVTSRAQVLTETRVNLLA